MDKDYKPHKIPSRMAGKIPESEKNGRRSRRHPDVSDAKTDNQVGFGSEDEVSEGHISVHNCNALVCIICFPIAIKAPVVLTCMLLLRMML